MLHSISIKYYKTICGCHVIILYISDFTCSEVISSDIWIQDRYNSSNDMCIQVKSKNHSRGPYVFNFLGASAFVIRGWNVFRKLVVKHVI